MERSRLDKLLKTIPKIGSSNFANKFPVYFVKSIADRALRLRYIGVFLFVFPVLYMNRYNLLKLGFHKPTMAENYVIKPDYLTGRLMILRRKDLPTIKYLS